MKTETKDKTNFCCTLLLSLLIIYNKLFYIIITDYYILAPVIPMESCIKPFLEACDENKVKFYEFHNPLLITLP